MSINDLPLALHIEPDVILYIELPKAFLVLEWETQEVAECEPVLVVCVDGQKTVVDHSSWGVLDDGVGVGVVKASPVCECVGPNVGSHEVLPVDSCGDVR